MKSLKRQLILWLVSLLTIISILTAGLSFFLELEETNSLQDNQLRHIARSVDEGSQLAAMRARFLRENEQEQARDFVIQVWMNNLPVRTSRSGFNLPHALHAGFSTQQLSSANQASSWRAYTLFYPDRIVQVSQSEEVRLNIAIQAALRALPRRWASAALLRAIGKNGWTFCGTGQFSARASTPVRIEMRNCPICRDTAADQPVCDYYAGAFERLFRALIDPAAEVREISCHATGAEACVFEIAPSRPMQARTRHPAPDPAGPAPIRG